MLCRVQECKRKFKKCSNSWHHECDARVPSKGFWGWAASCSTAGWIGSQLPWVCINCVCVCVLPSADWWLSRVCVCVWMDCNKLVANDSVPSLTSLTRHAHTILQNRSGHAAWIKCENIPPREIRRRRAHAETVDDENPNLTLDRNRQLNMENPLNHEESAVTTKSSMSYCKISAAYILGTGEGWHEIPHVIHEGKTKLTRWVTGKQTLFVWEYRQLKG